MTVKVKYNSCWPTCFAVAACLLLALPLAWAEQTEGKAEVKEPQEKALAARARKASIKAAQSPSAALPSKDYVIGPDDVLTINVWKEPEISQELSVRPDGKISLPLVGDIAASGFTSEQLGERITKKLLSYLSNPEVTVIVRAVNSRRFNIVGEITRPGTYDLTKQMTVLDAVAQAGGPLDFAKKGKMYVLRRLENGKSLRIPFNYKDILKGKNPQQNVELEPGDTIVVP